MSEKKHNFAKAPKEERIWRWGNKREDIEKISKLCEEAYEVICLHGVTAFAGDPPTEVTVSYAKVTDLIALGFDVYITPLDSTPEHRTVTLTKPITQKMIDKWNIVWGK